MELELYSLFNWLNNPNKIAEFRPFCKSLASNLPPWCNCDDLWQQTMYKLWENLHSTSPDGYLPNRLKAPKDLRNYIIKTINNAAKDIYREAQRKPVGQLGEKTNSLPAPENTTTNRSDIEAANRILNLARKRINGRPRHLLLRACTEPKTFKELAKEESINPKTISRSFAESNLRPVAKAIEEAAQEVLGSDYMIDFMEIVTHVFNPGKKVKRLIKRVKKIQNRKELCVEMKGE